jgi:glycosyltransferase involved in cell wall biosynthesis
MSVIKLSIVVPAFNEEATIIEILERIGQQTIKDVDFEVIVIDDGSKDRTVALLEARPELYAKFVKQPENGGKGAAVKAGLKEATGDYILFQDADLEYDPADYETIFLPALRFNADIVIGSRLVAPQFTRVSYFWHKLGNRFITFVFNIFYNMTFTDIYSCYLMYRRTLLDPDGLVAEGWDQHAEILCRVVKKGGIAYEVPISYHGRSYAEGKKIKAHHVIAVLWTIVRRRFLP